MTVVQLGPCSVEYPAHDANWQGRRRPTARAPTKEPADPASRGTGRGFHTHKKGRREHAKLPLHAPQPRVWLASSSAHRERATHRTTRRPYDGIRFVGREVTSLRADDQGGRANPPTIVELPWAPRAQEGRQQLTSSRCKFCRRSNQPKMVQASMDLNHFRFVLGASSHRSAAVGAGVLLSLHVYSRGPRLYVGPGPVA